MSPEIGGKAVASRIMTKLLAWWSTAKDITRARKRARITISHRALPDHEERLSDLAAIEGKIAGLKEDLRKLKSRAKKVHDSAKVDQIFAQLSPFVKGL